MKKLFWIRTGLLFTVLIFAVLGGNFLYTGAESASPLDMAADAVPLTEGIVLIQTFSPAHAKVTAISLALRSPEQSEPMSAASGTLTVTLSGHDTKEEIYRHTVSLEGVPDHWYLDFPVNCRLNADAWYDFSVSAAGYQNGENPSLYFVPQSAGIPEITENFTIAAESSNPESIPSPKTSGAAAMRLSYDVLVPFRLALFLAVLGICLIVTIAAAFRSRRQKLRSKNPEKKLNSDKNSASAKTNTAVSTHKEDKDTNTANDFTLGDFLSVKIFRVPLVHILFFAAVTIAAVILRIAFLPVKSNDYYLCYESWIHDMRSLGVWTALGRNIGDYPPLYVTPLTILSTLPFEPVVIIKLMPCVFDFVLAAASVKLSRRLGVTELSKRLTLYAVILLNPLTLLNSAAWGQCDSLYSSFLLLTLLSICGAKLWSTKALKRKKGAFRLSGDGICLLFAIAFSLKLQAVFFLPVLCLLWMMQKRNVLRPVQLLWIPIVYTISCIPMCLAGRSLKAMFKIYLGQADRNYGTLTLNYPNLYTLIGSWSEELYDSYFVYGMLLTFLLLIILFYRLYCCKITLDGPALCKVTALSILIICYCMPLVHERYAYVAETLLFIIMTKETKHVKTALITMLCTLLTYCTYLMQLEGSFSVLPDPVIACIRLGVIFYLTKDIFQTSQPSCNTKASE